MWLPNSDCSSANVIDPRGLIPRMQRGVELILYLMSSLLLNGLTNMAVVAVTQTDSNPSHDLGRKAAQCCTGNRRCCTVPAMEPNRAAVEIAVLYMCGADNRAAGEVLSTRGAPAGRPESSRFDGGDRCVPRAALRPLLSPLATPSSARCPVRRGLMVEHERQGHKCRPDEACRRYTSSGGAPPAPSISGETC